MTQEDKQLFYMDLCGRIPYEPYVSYNLYDAYGNRETVITKLFGCSGAFLYDIYGQLPDNAKLYLRTMSSMSKEEFDEYEKENDKDCSDSAEAIRSNLHRNEKHMSKWHHGVDWLNKHHFDYRGLIEKGLALEATKAMY